MFNIKILNTIKMKKSRLLDVRSKKKASLLGSRSISRFTLILTYQIFYEKRKTVQENCRASLEAQGRFILLIFLCFPCNTQRVPSPASRINPVLLLMIFLTLHVVLCFILNLFRTRNTMNRASKKTRGLAARLG